MTRDECEFLFPSRLEESIVRLGACRRSGCSEDEHRCADDESDWFPGDDAA